MLGGQSVNSIYNIDNLLQIIVDDFKAITERKKEFSSTREIKKNPSTEGKGVA